MRRASPAGPARRPCLPSTSLPHHEPPASQPGRGGVESARERGKVPRKHSCEGAGEPRWKERGQDVDCPRLRHARVGVLGREGPHEVHDPGVTRRGRLTPDGARELAPEEGLHDGLERIGVNRGVVGLGSAGTEAVSPVLADPVWRGAGPGGGGGGRGPGPDWSRRRPRGRRRPRPRPRCRWADGGSRHADSRRRRRSRRCPDVHAPHHARTSQSAGAHSGRFSGDDTRRWVGFGVVTLISPSLPPQIPVATCGSSP